ncbi:MAG: septum formation initiator family protein [Pseudomonadota bacterium]
MLKRWRRLALVLLPAAVAAAYFGYHAVYGRLGLIGREAVRGELVRVEAELAAVRQTNAALEAAIRGLRPETVEVDAVETVLREYGYIRPDQRVILAPEP